NTRYIKAIESGELPLTVEKLDRNDQFNEWVMTGLRTKWGLDIESGLQRFGIDLTTGNESLIKKLMEDNKAEYINGIFRLTKKGFFLADGIASSFFMIENGSE